MADTKISQLPAATTPLTGDEVIPVVQSGVTRKISVSDVYPPIATTTTAGIVKIDPNGGIRNGSTGLVANEATTQYGVSSVLAAGDHWKNIIATAAITLTLPQGATVWNGYSFTVYARGGDVTLQPNITDSVNGQAAGATYTILKGATSNIVCNGGTEWWPTLQGATGQTLSMPTSVPSFEFNPALAMDTMLVASSSAAYYTDKRGRISKTAANYPRLDWEAGKPGLLLERLSTNLLSDINAFSGAAWAGGATITDNTHVAPDGTQTADTITFTAANNQRYQTSATAAANGTPAAVSVWLKLISGGPQLTLAISRTGGLDAESNTITLTTNWQRFTFAHSSSWSGTSTMIATLQRAGVDVVVAAWGAQLETLPFSTSLMDAGSTRTADQLVATDMTWYNTLQGTFFCELSVGALGASYTEIVFAMDDGTTNNRLFLAVDDNSTDKLFGGYTVGGVAQPTVLDNAAAVVGDRYRVAISYTNNGIVMYVNGKYCGVSNGSAMPTTFTRLIFNHNSVFVGKVMKFAYYPMQLTAAEMQALTEG